MSSAATPSVPFRLFWRLAACALVALPVGTSLLVTSHTLAAVHLLALGWLAPMVVASMAQLVPVVTRSKVPGDRLLITVHALLVPGAWLMAAAFASGRLPLVPIGGALALAGLLVFALAQAGALARAPKWTFATVAIALALGGLVAGGLVGGAMALAFRSAAWVGALTLVAAHAHLMAVGWLSVLIMGLSYTLLPMFTLATGHSPTPGRWAVGLVAAGSALLAIAPRPAQILMAAGALLYTFDARRLLARRLKRRLDPGLTLVVGAIACLPALVFLGAIAFLVRDARGWLEAYGYLALTGWIGCSVLGYAYKIIPFMAWFHLFGRFPAAGRRPLADQLVSPKMASLAGKLLAIGIPATTAAIAAGWPAGWPGAITALGTAVAAADLLAAPYRRRYEAMSFPIMEALKDVIDPEYGLSVVDMGLIYEVEAHPEGNHVRMTLTTPTCPAADYLVSEVEACVRQATRRPTTVELVWEPAWTPERITPYGRAQLQA